MTDLEYSDPEQVARCKRLAVGVLQELILSLAGLSPTDQCGERDKHEKEKNRREGLRYIKAGEEELMGFFWICEVLGVDRQWLRKELLTNLEGFVRQWRAAGDKDNIWISNLRQGS